MGTLMTETIGMVPLVGCRCRCGHEWLPRVKGEKPRVCPMCKSANWDRPKRQPRTLSSYPSAAAEAITCDPDAPLVKSA